MEFMHLCFYQLRIETKGSLLLELCETGSLAEVCALNQQLPIRQTICYLSHGYVQCETRRLKMKSD